MTRYTTRTWPETRSSRTTTAAQQRPRVGVRGAGARRRRTGGAGRPTCPLGRRAGREGWQPPQPMEPRGPSRPSIRHADRPADTARARRRSWTSTSTTRPTRRRCRPGRAAGPPGAARAARRPAAAPAAPARSSGDPRGTLDGMAVPMRRPLAAGHHRASTPTRPDPARPTTNQQASRTYPLWAMSGISRVPALRLIRAAEVGGLRSVAGTPELRGPRGACRARDGPAHKPIGREGRVHGSRSWPAGPTVGRSPTRCTSRHTVAGRRQVRHRPSR